MYSVKNACYPSQYLQKTLYKEGTESPVSEENRQLTAEQPETGAEAEKEKNFSKERGFSKEKGFPEEEPAVLYLESLQKKEEEEGPGLVSSLLSQAEAIKEAFDREKQTNLYDATMDLMAIANAEKEPALKAIQVRLMYKMRTIKASGAKSSEIQIALNKIKKVLGKLKTKIKKLKEEAGIEQKRKNAARAKRRRMEEQLRRELEVRRTIRKKRERKDVEESRMGMGANYGGPGGNEPVSMKDFGLSGITDGSMPGDLIAGDSGLETGGVASEVAQAAMGAADMSGSCAVAVVSIDVSL